MSQAGPELSSPLLQTQIHACVQTTGQLSHKVSICDPRDRCGPPLQVSSLW